MEESYEYRKDGLLTKAVNPYAQVVLERDNRGRVISLQIEKNSHLLSEKSYLWGTNDKLLAVIADGKETRYEYDGWGNLSKTIFEDGKVEYRNPDRSGNLFESLDRMDRQYTHGGQLVKTRDWEYKYDAEGNLVRKKDKHGATWRYEWNVQGMLDKVKRPDGAEVKFRYDALGRRVAKQFRNIVTRWWWDGNVPLHEQKSDYFRDYNEEKGEFLREEKRPLVTWVFEEGTFVPTAKLTNQEKLSIATNYMGTPEAMYREDGEAVWKCELNSYGKVRKFQGEFVSECPFRFQGQYEDYETGLYYNRFRYYDCETGTYISQDPIRLRGGHTLYGYVHDPNAWVDILGLFDLFRGMKTEGDKPKVGASADTLGSRTSEITVVDGMVQPKGGGMSVNRDTDNIPPFRTPESWGGDQKGSDMYKIDSNNLGDRLEFVQDEDGTHGVISPIEPMTKEEYDKELAKLQDKFEKVCPPTK